MSEIKTLAEILVSDAEAMLAGKQEDYGSRLRVFEKTAVVASIIRGKLKENYLHPMDVCAVMIALKLVRYGNLAGEGKVGDPNFESLTDTTKDTINYVAIMEEVRRELGLRA